MRLLIKYLSSYTVPLSPPSIGRILLFWLIPSTMSADFVHEAADAMLLYKVANPTNRAKELVDIVVQVVVEVEKAVSEINDRIERKHLMERCVEINRLENVGDSVFRSAMAELFDDSSDFAGVIKWREIYTHMESVIDRCEDIANILEGVAIKYA